MVLQPFVDVLPDVIFPDVSIDGLGRRGIDVLDAERDSCAGSCVHAIIARRAVTGLTGHVVPRHTHEALLDRVPGKRNGPGHRAIHAGAYWERP